jgi:predicted nucleotidyltransferase
MRRERAIALLSAHRAAIAERFGVRSLSLFGSTARGEARDDSDVDVLVEFDGPTTFRAHMGLAVYLEDLLRTRVDVLTVGGLSERLRAAIAKDLVHVEWAP